jgi:hypothetical protein
LVSCALIVALPVILAVKTHAAIHIICSCARLTIFAFLVGFLCDCPAWIATTIAKFTQIDYNKN